MRKQRETLHICAVCPCQKINSILKLVTYKCEHQPDHFTLQVNVASVYCIHSLDMGLNLTKRILSLCMKRQTDLRGESKHQTERH